MSWFPKFCLADATCAATPWRWCRTGRASAPRGRCKTPRCGAGRVCVQLCSRVSSTAVGVVQLCSCVSSTAVCAVQLVKSLDPLARKRAPPGVVTPPPRTQPRPRPRYTTNRNRNREAETLGNPGFKSIRIASILTLLSGHCCCAATLGRGTLRSTPERRSASDTVP
jgi:hypothetical protein